MNLRAADQGFTEQLEGVWQASGANDEKGIATRFGNEVADRLAKAATRARRAGLADSRRASRQSLEKGPVVFGIEVARVGVGAAQVGQAKGAEVSALRVPPLGVLDRVLIQVREVGEDVVAVTDEVTEAERHAALSLRRTAVARATEAPRDFRTSIGAAKNDVDDASDRIGTVHRGSAVEEDLDLVHDAERNLVQIGEGSVAAGILIAKVNGAARPVTAGLPTDWLALKPVVQEAIPETFQRLSSRLRIANVQRIGSSASVRRVAGALHRLVSAAPITPATAAGQLAQSPEPCSGGIYGVQPRSYRLGRVNREYAAPPS